MHNDRDELFPPLLLALSSLLNLSLFLFSIGRIPSREAGDQPSQVWPRLSPRAIAEAT